jgi:hypothetical protein
MATATANKVIEFQTVVVEKKVTDRVTLELTLDEAKGLVSYIGVTSVRERRAMTDHGPHMAWSEHAARKLSGVYDALKGVPELSFDAAVADLKVPR